MSQEQGKKTSEILGDAAVKEVIPAKPAGDFSDEDLDNVAGGTSVRPTFEWKETKTVIESPKL